jgi:hypothetical protein
MLILRLSLILLALLMMLSGGMYFFTRNWDYLYFAWKVLRFTVLLIMVFSILFVLERYVLIAII